MSIEIELKLSIAAKDVELLHQHPYVKQHAHAEPQKEKLLSVYFDSADQSLQQHGFALRIRKVGNRFLQTLKNAGKYDAGRHHREEWDAEVNSLEPDLNLITDQKVREQLINWLQDRPLVPLFKTEFIRTSWQLSLPDQSEIELALDQGEITADQRSEIISEIELELKTGNKEILNEVAAILSASIPLVFEKRSKAERGYHLYML